MSEEGHEDGAKLVRERGGEPEERGETCAGDIGFARTRARPLDALQEKRQEFTFGALERQGDTSVDGFTFDDVKSLLGGAHRRITPDIERA